VQEELGYGRLRIRGKRGVEWGGYKKGKSFRAELAVGGIAGSFSYMRKRRET
jgi:hypothetical protein